MADRRRVPVALQVVRVLDWALSVAALAIAGLLLWVSTEPLLRDAAALAPVPALFGAIGVMLAWTLGRGSRPAWIAQLLWAGTVAAWAIQQFVRLLRAYEGPGTDTTPPSIVLPLLALIGIGQLTLLLLPSSLTFFRLRSSSIEDVSE